MSVGMESAPEPLDHLVVGVCGSVALYGILPQLAALRPTLIRHLYIAMSPSAVRMIHPALASSITGADAVVTDPYDLMCGQAAHIALAERADAVLLAPATAHSLSSLAHGLASTLPQLIALCTSAPTDVVPVLNSRIEAKPAIRRVLAQIEADGIELCHSSAGTGRTLSGRVESGPDPHALRLLVRSLAIKAAANR